MSYGTKVIRKHDELVIAAGGKLTVEEGATVSGIESGGGAVAASAVTATAITPGTATNVQGILAELAARITALENAGT